MRNLIYILLLMAVSWMPARAQVENRALYDSLKLICDTTSDPELRMGLLRDMAMSTNKFSEIYTNGMRLYHLSESVGNRFRHAQGASIVSHSYSIHNDFDNALTYAFEALDIYKELDSVKFVARSLNQLGCIFSNSLNHEKALIYFCEAYDLCQKYGLKDIMHEVSTNIGYIYIDMKLYTSAIGYLLLRDIDTLRPERLYTYYNSKVGLISAHLELYQYYGERKHLDAAYNYVLEINPDELLKVNVFPFANYSVNASEVYLELSKISDRKANMDTALMFLDRGQAVINRMGYSIFNPQFISLRCKVCMENGNLDEIPELFMQYDTCTIFTNPIEMIKIKKDYYKKIKKYSTALVYSELYSRLLNSSYNLEFASNAECHPAEQRYIERKRQMQKQTDERIRRHEQEMSYWLFAKILLIIIGVFVVFLLFHNYNNARLEKHQTAVLNFQKQDLMVKTEKLEHYQNEIRSQCIEIEKQTAMLKNQRVELNSKHMFLIENIQTANIMQRAVVPSEETVNRVFGEAFVMWRPLDIVSGDFYWTTNYLGRKYLIVADCTGHGVPGAMLSILGVSILNHLLPQYTRLDAAQVLELLKAKFLDSISNMDIDDGMDLALIIREGNVIQYAGANRPLLRVHDGEVTEYKPTRICIGHNFMKEHVKFANNVIEVKDGDMLYAFSDGLTDQFGGSDGHDKFGNKGIRNLVAGICNEELMVQKRAIETAIDNWRNVPFYDRKQVPQIDDELMIGVRITA